MTAPDRHGPSGVTDGVTAGSMSLPRLALAPVMATLALRLAVVCLLPTAPAWDGVIYVRLAAHLAAGLGYTDGPAGAPASPTAFYPVGLPAAVALLSPIAGTVARAALVVNLLSACVACIAAVALGRHLGGPRTGLRAGMAYALAPGAALWCVAVMTETLHGALLALACVAALVPWHLSVQGGVTDTRRAGSLRTAGLCAAGLLAGAATLVRPQALVVAPLLGALSRPGSLRARLLRGALTTILALAVVAPWTARNCATVGGCALVSTNGGSNLLIGTFPEVLGGYRRPAPRDGCDGIPTEAGRDRCMRKLALTRIRMHPFRWLVGGGWKLARTVGWEHDPVTYLRRAHPCLGRPVPFALAVAGCTAAWWTLLVLALRGACRAGASAALPVAMVLAIIVTHAIFLGADRYHLALVPLMCPLAALGWQTYPHRRCST